MDDDKEKYLKIKEQNFLVIPNFLTEKEADWYYGYFTLFLKNTKATLSDTQCPEGDSVYNFLPFVHLLSNKTERVSKILGVNIVPTYSYARKYYNNSVLKKHRDREACEISLSVHLDGDKEWDLIIKGYPVSLNKGDAVLYWGHQDEHWREPYTGDSYTNVFLHYVRLFSPYSRNYFDLKSLYEDPPRSERSKK